MTNEQRKEESQRKALDELVLFEGNLEQLNAQNPSRQYELINNERPYEFLFIGNPNIREQIMRENVASNGYNGLVNYRLTEMENNSLIVAYEGTPIKLKQEASQ